MDLKVEKIKEIIKKNKDIIIVIFAIIILSILKQLLIQGYPIVAYVGAGEDDALMVKLAYNILDGKWLGEYRYNTLMKGPVFPMLLVLLYKLKLPFIFSMTLLYTISSIVFMIAIRKLIKNKYCFIGIFAIILFNPIMYSADIIQRIYRNALIPSFALLITGSYLALFLRRNEKNIYLVIWSLIAGVSLSTFYYTREDSMWIVPFVIFITIATIVYKLLEEKKINFEVVSKTFFVIVPVIMLVLFGKCIALKNEKYYGLRTKNILSESNFTAALNAIYSVRPNKMIDCVTVTQEKVDRMAAVSPSFETIAPKLHETIGGLGRLDRNPDDAEIEDGWVLWALRTAVVGSGYNTLEAEQDIYARIATELNSAMEQGLLERQHVMPSPLLSPYRKNYTFNLFKSVLESIRYVSTFDELAIANDTITTDTETRLSDVQKFENISNERALYTEKALLGDENSFDNVEEQEEYINSLKINNIICNTLIKIYSVLGVILGIIAIIYYIVLTVDVIKEFIHKEYKNIQKWIVLSGILGALFTLIMGISYNNVATCDSIKYLYLCGTYSLYLAFCMLSVYNAFIHWNENKKMKS